MAGMFYHCNTQLRLLHWLYDIDFTCTKHAFSMFYTLIEYGFLTNQRALIIDMRLLHCFGYYRYDMYAMHVYYFLGKKFGHFAKIYSIKRHTFYRHFVRVICVYFTNFLCIL